MYIFLFTNLILLLNNKFRYNSGFDERFPLINNENKNDLIKCIENYEKKKLLLLLELPNISLLEKLERINKFNKDNLQYSNNIFNGGLLKDWDFEF